MLGTWILTTDPTIMELMCEADLDFLAIDAEHGPASVETIQTLLMVARGCNPLVMVRVAWNDHVLIKRVMDAGASAIIIPMVNTREEAQRAVAACRYPPTGSRGYGPRRPTHYGRRTEEWINGGHEDVLSFVMIEQVAAVSNLDAILAVPGVDGIWLGASDLAASMGLLGKADDPRVANALRQVIKSARSAGVPVASYCGEDAATIAGWVEAGVQLVTASSDTDILRKAVDETIMRVRHTFASGGNDDQS